MRDHPIMIMEYNETNMKQCNVLKQDVDAFLKKMGYEWKLISTKIFYVSLLHLEKRFLQSFIVLRSYIPSLQPF